MAPQKDAVTRHRLVVDLRKMFRFAGRKRQIQAFGLLALSALSAIAEVVGIGLIVPFLALVVSPDQAFETPMVTAVAAAMGIGSAQELLLPVTLAFSAAAVFAVVVRLAASYASIRFAYSIGAELSSEVYRGALLQPYSFHAGRNSGWIVGLIRGQVDGVVGGVLIPLIGMAGSILSVAAVSLTLVLLDPVVATLAFLGFGSLYFAVHLLARAHIKASGELMARNQERVFRALNEGLGGIRDVILNNAQTHYVDAYKRSDYPLRQAAGGIAFLSGSTRIAVEGVAMLLIGWFAYSLARQEGGALGALPTLGALALGGQRLLPALNQIFSAAAMINGYRSYLRDTLEALEWRNVSGKLGTTGISFNSQIRLDNVTYSHSEGQQALSAVSLTVPKGAKVGVVGPTGSGKSTLADLLMGLLSPESGAVYIDGVRLTDDNIVAWRRIVAHVPQLIYLVDGSFADNIVIGDPQEPDDPVRIERAARLSQLSDVVRSRGGLNAFVGENGIQLSGGQRQRLGIARALYKHAELLVLDEATSALDTATEADVVAALESLDPGLTVFVIAHRVKTLKSCDLIVRMEAGRIVEVGSYSSVIEGESN